MRVERRQRQREDRPSGEITVIPGSAAVASQNFSRFGYGADLRLGVHVPRLGATILCSELYWAKNLDRGVLPADPVSFGRDYREFGLYVGVTQELGQHATVGVRYDFYNPDADSVNTVMGADRADRARVPDASRSRRRCARRPAD